MNEQLLEELRGFRTIVKSRCSEEEWSLISTRIRELARLHTWPVLHEACEFVASEGANQ